ncbi:MAG: AAA family ATPase, partial [Alphaproteobacteria bacterium]
RRTAPEIYRGTAPVTREPDGRLALGGSGRPVDWVVVMARFEEDSLLDRMAGRGALDEQLMERLAEEIARFHAAAERGPEHGGRAGMARVIESNARAFAECPRETFAPGEVALLDAALSAALERHGVLLDRRRAEGKVRRCHGDLHLRNVCLIDGRPTLFDAIEFDDDLATIDVLYDFAFLLMDMEHRGLRPLANRAFNRYLDLALEFRGLAGLPLFLACRAAVRAHVSAASAQAQASRESAARLESEARAYLALALTLATPPVPRLVAVGGLSGTGKSTLAKALAPDLGPVPGAVLLRSDVVRKGLLGARPTEPLPEEAYRVEVTERVYATMLERARWALAAGHSAVLDAVYGREDHRAAVDRLAWEARCPFTGIWLEAPLDVMVERVGVRREDASDATAAIVRRQRESVIGRMDWIRIDAAGEAPSTARAARAALGLLEA